MKTTRQTTETTRHDAHYYVQRQLRDIRRKQRERAEREGSADDARELIAEASIWLGRQIDNGGINDADLVAVGFLSNILVNALSSANTPESERKAAVSLQFRKAPHRPKTMTPLHRAVINEAILLPSIDKQMLDHKIDASQARPGVEGAIKKAAKSLSISYSGARRVWDDAGGLAGYRERETQQVIDAK